MHLHHTRKMLSLRGTNIVFQENDISHITSRSEVQISYDKVVKGSSVSPILKIIYPFPIIIF